MLVFEKTSSDNCIVGNYLDFFQLTYRIIQTFLDKQLYINYTIKNKLGVLCCLCGGVLRIQR